LRAEPGRAPVGPALLTGDRTRARDGRVVAKEPKAREAPPNRVGRGAARHAGRAGRERAADVIAPRLDIELVRGLAKLRHREAGRVDDRRSGGVAEDVVTKRRRGDGDDGNEASKTNDESEREAHEPACSPRRQAVPMAEKNQQKSSR